ncbi:ribonuclease H-like domain-containing protein, partial [Tanacetum coccineum]
VSAFDSSVNEIEEENNQVNDRFKKVEGYHVVSLPYTGNYMPSRPYLSFAGLDDSVYKTNSDSDDDCVTRPLFEQNKPSYAKIKFVKSNTRKSVIEQNTYRQAENLRKSQSPRVDKRNWNGLMTQKLGDGFEFKKKAYFICGSFNHLIKDYNFYENKIVGKSVLNNMGRVTGKKEVRPVWNNAQRVNHQNKLTHPHLKRNFVPTTVATKSGLVPVNAAKQSTPRAAASISTARHVNTAASKPRVNAASPTKYSYFKPHSPLRRPLKISIVSTAEGKRENAIKSSSCWIWRPTGKVIDHISTDRGSYMPKRFDYGNPQYTLQDQGIFDSGCSRHMIGNKSFLTDYQEVDGGFVAFVGSPKGGKITCVACQKGKKHKASCKIKINRVLVTKPHNKTPYQLLLGRPPSISFMRPFGCLVTILNTLDPLGKFDGKADEGFLVGYSINSKAFKVFNTRTRKVEENLHTRTRKNRTLIEAARTMLADSLLPTTFWAEAVNTACYVQNRVLVNKPHNKTPYELLLGRPPSISFMRPFGCLVTILNTLDPLGKFDGKADEGFLVGYSINSKAFRVFNTRTRKVEENLHINFLENKPNVAGSGPEWLFDINSLTKSMNYEPITAGNQTNVDAGIDINVNAGQAR